MYKHILRIIIIISVTSGSVFATLPGNTTDKTTLRNSKPALTSKTKKPQTKKEVAQPESLNKSGLIAISAINPEKINLSGFLNETAFYAYDGHRGRMFYGNDAVQYSRLTFSAKTNTNENTDAFGTFELGINNDSSNDVSQLNPSPGNSLIVRIAEVGLHSKSAGKLSLGLGWTASDYSAEVDLSGTAPVNTSAIQKMGGSLIFSNASNGALTGNPTVKQAFDNLDGLQRKNRVRYDTPKFFGFTLSGSLIEKNMRDITLRYENEFSAAKLAAAIAYTNTSLISSRVPGYGVDGSASLLLNCGLNFTLASGKVGASNNSRDNPTYIFLKPGYQLNLFEIGKTNTSFDYGFFNNFATNGDRGKVFDLDIVQQLEHYNADIYFGFRKLMLDRESVKLDNINMFISGMKFKF